MPTKGEILRVTVFRGQRLPEPLWVTVTQTTRPHTYAGESDITEIDLEAGPAFDLDGIIVNTYPRSGWSLEHSSYDLFPVEYETFTEDTVPREYWAAIALRELLS